MAGVPNAGGPVGASSVGCFDVEGDKDQLTLTFVVHPNPDGSVPAAQSDLYVAIQNVLLTIQTLSQTKGWLPIEQRAGVAEKPDSQQLGQAPAQLLQQGGTPAPEIGKPQTEVPNRMQAVEDQGVKSRLRKVSGRDAKASSRLSGYLERLLGCAKVGLQGNPDVEPRNLVATDLANKELELLKSEIVMKEGALYKNRFAWFLGLTCLAWALPLSIFFFWLPSSQFEPWRTNLHWFCPLGVGAMTGLWFSFLLRKKDMTFADLSGFDTDRIRPGIRCAFIIILAAIMFALLRTNFLSLSVAGSKVDLVAGSRWVGFLIGVAVGVSERAMGDTVVGALPGKK